MRAERCCEWMRSASDAVYDPVERRSYCGTCWQGWLNSTPRPSAAKYAADTCAEPPKDADNDSSKVEEDEVPCDGPELQGVLRDGTLYLVDRASRTVYSSERDEQDALVTVGTLGEDEQVILRPAAAPFSTDASDNCETPLEAYQDIAPTLRAVAQLLGKTPATLRIWDPYYCDGGVARKLAALGFPRVHNAPEDFYSVAPPPHDVVVTNPPYSGDHVERMFKRLSKLPAPWFVVLPAFVYMKPYFSRLDVSPRPFFITPASPRRYVYRTPRAMRDVRAAALKTAPFVSFWYCWGAEYTGQLWRAWAQTPVDAANPTALACTPYHLGDRFKSSDDKSRRKKRRGKEPKGAGGGGGEQSTKRRRK